MEKQFFLAVTKDYKKVLRRTFIPLFVFITTIILFSLLLEFNFLDPESVPFVLILTIAIVSMPITILFLVKGLYSKENLIITSNLISSKSINEIKYSGIKKIRQFNVRGGYSLIVTLKQDNKKIAFAPSNNFKEEAESEYQKFVLKITSLYKSQL